MNTLLELILSKRGISTEQLASYENPEHGELENIALLADKLASIHDSHTKLVVLPDYDMDGIMSAIVGYAGFSQLGFDVELFIPDPKEGYGFGENQIRRLIEQHPGVGAIISCDCGISCYEGVEFGNSQGIEMLITDHHLENADTSPRGIASVIVDPCSLTDSYEHPAICGAHVLWQCLDYYARRYQSEQVSKIWWLRAFAGVGTISDVMPVLYENRLLVRDSIEIFRKAWSCEKDFLDAIEGTCDAYKQAFRGIYTACKVFSEKGKVANADLLDEQFFGFYLAPAFNSAKRMDGEMSKAYGVFKDRQSKDDIEYLFALNEKRKRLVTQKFAEMRVQDNPMAPYCYIVDAPAGILGLLAMRALEMNQVPCVVVSQNADGSYHGSGRSPEWYPFLSRAKSPSWSIAGHEGAFGCGFPGEESLEELHDFLVRDVPSILEDMPEVNEPQVDYVIADDGDGDVGIDCKLFMDFVDELATLKPFGRGMEEPVGLLRFDAGNAQWSTIGQQANHLKIVLPGGLDVLCWNQSELLDDGIPSGTIEVVGKLSINEFNGNRTVQFMGDVL